MSAFLCSDRHTAVVAQLMHAHGIATGERSALQTALRRANNAALAHRYGDAAQPLRNRLKAQEAAALWLDEHPAISQHLRVVECFEYQCNEGDTLAQDGPHKAVAVALRALQCVLVAELQSQRPSATFERVWSI